MAAGTPLTWISLGAASIADDLGYVALTDLALALGDLTDEYRVIGGHEELSIPVDEEFQAAAASSSSVAVGDAAFASGA